MIDFYALDFSECCPEEVSFFWRSVKDSWNLNFLGLQKGLTTCTFKNNIVEVRLKKIEL